MAKVDGVSAILKALKRLEGKYQTRKAKAGIGENVVVGFTAAYALFVHEDMEAYHKVGQAKFLEQPARELSDNGTLGGIVRKAVLAGKSVLEGLLLAGLRLQREAQLLAPVDTGNLRASAFTRIE